MDLQEQNMIKNISSTLSFYNCTGYGHATIVIDALELEHMVEDMKMHGDLYLLGSAQKYLYKINSFKMNQNWSVDTNEINYGERIKDATYVYYCLKGTETEKHITGKTQIMDFLKGEEPSEDAIDRMWNKAKPIFFSTYKRITQYAEYIPMEFDELICEVVKDFKDGLEFNHSEYFDPEPILFMYGFLNDLMQIVEKEKPKSINAPFGEEWI